MGKKNSLESPPTSAKVKNGIGRPCVKKTITFSPQPKSIVSQMLQKMVMERKVILPIEQNDNSKTLENTIYLDDEDSDNLCDLEETDQNEDFTPKPKKTIKSKCKEETKPKSFCCDFTNCSYNTKISSNLQKHKRIHTTEKPYLCDKCSFRSNFSNSLKVHKRLHTDARPYQCTHCDYRCNSVSNLKKHSHAKHKNSND